MPILILLRHGQSTYNDTSKFCGWVDAPLTEKGRQQAVETAQLIKSHPLTHHMPLHTCVTSRLQRAVSTAHIILENLGRLDMDVKKSWRLNERHYGALQGRIKNDVLEQYDHEQFLYWRRAYSGCPPDADINGEFYKDTLRIGLYDSDLSKFGLPKSESLELVIKRLIPFWSQNIMPELYQGKNVLCVTHGSVVRALLTILYNISEQDVETLNVPNGIPILIELDDVTGEPTTDFWIYLDPEKAKIEAERVRVDGLIPATAA